MGKSVFTIIFLIVSLFLIAKIESFIKNNTPINIPENNLPENSFDNQYELVNPVIYNSEDIDQNQQISSSTATSTNL